MERMNGGQAIQCECIYAMLVPRSVFDAKILCRASLWNRALLNFWHLSANVFPKRKRYRWNNPKCSAVGLYQALSFNVSSSIVFFFCPLSINCLTKIQPIFQPFTHFILHLFQCRANKKGNIYPWFNIQRLFLGICTAIFPTTRPQQTTTVSFQRSSGGKIDN